MLHETFGEIVFDIGWKAKKYIKLFGKDYEIKIKLQAYFEEDGTTKEQEKAYLEFSNHESEKMKIIEKILSDYSEYAEQQFRPQVLLFNRDGSYALLCDDYKEPDEGIAVCLSPKEEVLLQDDYL